MGEKTHKVGNSIPRIIFVALAVLLQVVWLLVLVLRFNAYSNWIAFASTVIALVVVVRLYSKHTSPAFKLPWIMLIMALPVMGLTLYLMVEVFSDLGSFRSRMAALVQERRQRLPQKQEVAQKLDPDCAGYSRYLQETGSAPVYETTKQVTGYKYTGWQTIDGATYYFDKNGNKVTGDQIIQGGVACFDLCASIKGHEESLE